MQNKYPIEIFYSHDDEGYISIAPDLSGCSAFGETEEKALSEVKIAIALWIEAALGEGRTVPEPSNYTILDKIIAYQKASVI